MQTAKIKEEGKPVWEAQIENFDPDRKKQGSFEAAQFGEGARKLSVPSGSFTLTLGGKTYRCQALISTHFSIIEASIAEPAKAAASGS